MRLVVRIGVVRLLVDFPTVITLVAVITLRSLTGQEEHVLLVFHVLLVVLVIRRVAGMRVMVFSLAPVAIFVVMVVVVVIRVRVGEDVDVVGFVVSRFLEVFLDWGVLLLMIKLGVGVVPSSV